MIGCYVSAAVVVNCVVRPGCVRADGRLAHSLVAKQLTTASDR